MQKIIFFLLFILLSQLCFSQSLTGEWKGRYEISQNNYYPIRLVFTLKKDSTYAVYSLTPDLPSNRHDTTVVCEMKIKMRNDSVYLKEVKVILPEDRPGIGFQRMLLKINERRKYIELNGMWESAPYDGTQGKIYFIKKK